MNFETTALRKTPRNKFDLSHERKMSLNMAYVYPMLCEEIVPGDQWKVQTEIMIRLAPMLAPVMHRMDVFTHYFFVPNRLLWNEWEDFITGGKNGTSMPSFPRFKLTPTESAAKTLADYFGIGQTVNNTYNAEINALPFRAYQMIWTEYYRDPNLMDEVGISLGSGLLSDADKAVLMPIKRRCWEKDYFTSALPWTQRGGDVLLPLQIDGATDINYSNPAKTAGQTGTLSADTSTYNIKAGTTDAVIRNIDSIDVGATTINDLRKATKLQEWLEVSARAGYRYIEQIKSYFGVRSSDARLQRPEFLGGGKQPIVISETLTTYENPDGTSAPVGSMYGHGISVGNQHGFTRFFEEHGWLIATISILPRTAYQDGVPRQFLKFDKFDYYFPQFANLGEQEVKNTEIRNGSGSNANWHSGVFGYQQRYAEYKYKTDSVHGDFRTTLSYWHMGRIFTTDPALNANFVQADQINRIFNVEADTEDHFWAQIYHNISALRPIPYLSVPSLT